MARYLTKEKKEEIFEQYGGSKTNTGSTEGQIALMTFRVKSLSDHLKINPKDHASRTALLNLVGRRKNLLKYLAKKDIESFRKLTAKLGIRK